MPGEHVSRLRRFWRWLFPLRRPPERCSKCGCVLIGEKDLVKGQYRWTACFGPDSNGDCLHLEMVLS